MGLSWFAYGEDGVLESGLKSWEGELRLSDFLVYLMMLSVIYDGARDKSNLLIVYYWPRCKMSVRVHMQCLRALPRLPRSCTLPSAI